MEPLITNHRVSIWLCICPADENTSKLKKILHRMFSGFCVISMICTFIASLIFALKNTSAKIEESLFAMLQIVTISAMIYMLVVASILRRKIANIFKSLSDICRASK